jgi:NAD-dependent dihydropyrimidine dehydrogenase PreA subunit
MAEKELPVFALSRCKRCDICSHFCPVEAIGVTPEGVPFLAKPQACTSCRLCEDLCPDWAIGLQPGGREGCLLAQEPSILFEAEVLLEMPKSTDATKTEPCDAAAEEPKSAPESCDLLEICEE